MSARFFLDTNIFVYSFDATAARKAARAAQLIRQAMRTRSGIISYQVVQEFFKVAMRRFAVPMTMADAEQYLSTTFRPLLAVHSSAGLYGEALRVAGRYKLAWFDALIVASAMEGECEVLYSEDLQDGQSFGSLRVSNPFL
jgi:predicted nucleic acid-binding protein